jgi:hypothetical protein
LKHRQAANGGEVRWNSAQGAESTSRIDRLRFDLA